MNLEDLRPLQEIAAELPGRSRNGSLTHWTLRRWATKGLRNTRLQVWRVGRTICTTRQAVDEFLAILNGTASPVPPATDAPPSPLVQDTEEYLQTLTRLGRDTIAELVGPGEDHHYFEIDDLQDLTEISEGSDGVWVRGWVLVDKSQLWAAGLWADDDDKD